MFDSVGYVAMRTALDGLAMRQRVIADNVSNIQTPGFLAGRVTFEDELARAVELGRPQMTHVQTSRSLEPTRMDGNNVNLDTETISNVDTVLRFQLATQALDGEFSSIRAAMRTTS
ncbi:MAG: flagellar basal body rod protein FlgB [Actinomycetaceae bacterium]|nr:flagellar basal body rod protein FlgB [Actinomycetaceae bacterium]